jgi:hypothetical protein
MTLEAEVVMLIVETIAKIRRAFFVQGKSIKAICRELRESHGGSYVRLSDQKQPSSATSERQNNRFQRSVHDVIRSINCYWRTGGRLHVNV